MNECLICNKEFRSLRGMRSHHKRMHGKSLLEISCQTCGKLFPNYEGDRKFCSLECAGKHFSVLYSQNKSAVCGKEFSLHPNKLKQAHNFCSRNCYLAWLRRRQYKISCAVRKLFVLLMIKENVSALRNVKQNGSLSRIRAEAKPS